MTLTSSDRIISSVTFAEWLGSIRPERRGRVSTVDYSQVKVLCVQTLEEKEQTYEVVAAYNPSTRGIDLVIIHADHLGRPVPLIGANFVGETEEGNFVDIPVVLGEEVALKLCEAFAEACRSHLQFLIALRSAELQLDVPPPGHATVKKLTGVMGEPK